MITIKRTIHHEGVYVQERHFYSTEFSRLAGKTISIEIPEGPLPKTLDAWYEPENLRLTLLEFIPETKKHLYEKYIREDLIQMVHLLLYSEVGPGLSVFYRTILSPKEQARLIAVTLEKQKQVRELLLSKPDVCSSPITLYSMMPSVPVRDSDCSQSSRPVDSEKGKDC